MENKDSALLQQVQGGLNAYLMIGLSVTSNDVTSSFGLYNQDGEEIEGDVLDLLSYVWLTYQYVAEGLDLPAEKVHEMVGQAMKDIHMNTGGKDIND